MNSEKPMKKPKKPEETEAGPERPGKLKDSFSLVGGKPLRNGLTTGTCAAAAAACASDMILTGRLPETDIIKVILPGGEEAGLPIEHADFLESSNRQGNREETDGIGLSKATYNSCKSVLPHANLCGRARASVIKDGGDDPDVTTGLEIIAEVTIEELPDEEETIIAIEGGKGIGRVTKEGLSIPPGQAAINPVPRRMIKENILKVIEERVGKDRKWMVNVTISSPGGEDVAKRTFNPKLGIEGGISIIGTTGIVQAMSEKALVDTVKLLIDRAYYRNRQSILITPGNYGEEFCREDLGLNMERAVQVSNFVGEALDYIRYRGFKKVLFVGHTGKLIKTAAGIMQTHSKYADGRMEIIAAHAAANGAGSDKVKEILGSLTTDQAFDIVNGLSKAKEIKEDIMEASLRHLRDRIGEGIELEVIMFTHSRESVLKSPGADEMIKEFSL
jgi:cobalt-precorrin-5B (C1)-methyltransferase